MSKKPQDSAKPLPPDPLATESDLPPDADLEERFNDFWKRNGAGIFGGIAIGAVVVIGIQFFQYFQDRREDGIREAFAAAQGIPAKQEFAAAHPKHQLGALAQLQVADARYESGEYDAAAGAYADAARIFADPVLASRALLGQGMSLLRTGATEAGLAVLESVALDAAALAQTRAEAAYHSAVVHWESGDLQRVDEMTGMILDLEAPFWVFRASALRERLELDAVAATGS
jgi:predicted negative regulator of RcsB-dependent stress response